VLALDAVVELVWQDETGSTAVTLLHTPSSLTVAEIDADAMALASILASLTDCTLVKSRIKYRNRPEERPVPVSDTPIHEQAVFIFATDDVTPLALIAVPSIKDSIMLTTGFGSGFIVDTSLDDVIAFIDACISLPVCSPFSDEAISLESAYRQSRV